MGSNKRWTMNCRVTGNEPAESESFSSGWRAWQSHIALYSDSTAPTSTDIHHSSVYQSSSTTISSMISLVPLHISRPICSSSIFTAIIMGTKTLYTNANTATDVYPLLVVDSMVSRWLVTGVNCCQTAKQIGAILGQCYILL